MLFATDHNNRNAPSKIVLLLIFYGLGLGVAMGQTIEKATFERAVDYINCRIQELSFKDQKGQRHLASFNAEVKPTCDFVQIVQFCKTRPNGEILKKNIALAYTVEGYKERYASNLPDEALFDILTKNLYQDSMLVEFRTNHPNLLTLQKDLEAYLTTVFKQKQRTTQTFDLNDQFGDVEMVKEMEEDSISNTFQDSPFQQTTEADSIEAIENPPFQDYDPIERADEIFSWSSWLLRLSLLIFSLAVLLFVLLPYLEKRDKAARLRKLGGEVHPTALALKVELEGLKNRNRLLREQIRTLHIRLNELESFK